MEFPLIPVILGPTASDKTSVGIELAKLMDGEVISIDSRKVYKDLPIGTATPRGKWEGQTLFVKSVPHHLMGFLSPDHPYNAGDFARDAERLIAAIQKKGKVPILVGGTGFYFKALSLGLPPLPPADPEFRKNLEARIEADGLESVHAELKRIDPEAHERITKGDRHKIIRSLEIFHLTGRPSSSWKSERKGDSHLQFVVMALKFPHDLLDKRIEERSKHMLDAGMIEETEAVLKKGFAPDCHALSSFGYREAVQVIQGTLPRNEFLARLVHGTKAYAKRQRTWFRTQVKPAWFPCDEFSKKEEMAMKMKAFCYTPRPQWSP